MKPFWQQLAWTLVAVALYVLPVMLEGLEEVRALAGLIVGATWGQKYGQKQEARRHASVAPMQDSGGSDQ